MPGLEGMDKYPGHLEAQISLHLIFLVGVQNRWGISSTCKTGSHQSLKLLTRDMIQETWQEIEFYLDVSRATNGAHNEMYWGKSKTLTFFEYFKTQNVYIRLVLFKL